MKAAAPITQRPAILHLFALRFRPAVELVRGRRLQSVPYSAASVRGRERGTDLSYGAFSLAQITSSVQDRRQGGGSQFNFYMTNYHLFLEGLRIYLVLIIRQ